MIKQEGAVAASKAEALSVAFCLSLSFCPLGFFSSSAVENIVFVCIRKIRRVFLKTKNYVILHLQRGETLSSLRNYVFIIKCKFAERTNRFSLRYKFF